MTDSGIPMREGVWARTRARIDPATLAAFGCILVLLFAGSLYSQSFLSPAYLLQQLKVASFLGIIATGMMIVILLGQIDLSVPWAIAVGGMMSASASAWGPAGPWIAIPFGVACGVALGLVNGIGVAYLRIPSMIVTLAVNAVAQGLMVVHTGGFSPQDSASPAMRVHRDRRRRVRSAQCADRLGDHRHRRDAVCSTRTTFGRAVYAIGNRERAAYLSGVDPQRVTLIAFMISGGLSAFAGVLLAGYASKAAQAMGDPYLLPAIAAVVLGGASILGGRGNYLGTVAGGDSRHAAAVDPLGDADPRGRAADRRRVGDHRHAAVLRRGGDPGSVPASAARRNHCASRFVTGVPAFASPGPQHADSRWFRHRTRARTADHRRDIDGYSPVSSGRRGRRKRTSVQPVRRDRKVHRQLWQSGAALDSRGGLARHAAGGHRSRRRAPRRNRPIGEGHRPRRVSFCRLRSRP